MNDEGQKRRGPAVMTDEHKAAIAVGRVEARAVKAYLEALVANKPRRGRRRTPDSIRARIAKISLELADAAPLLQVQLVQERMDLTVELEKLENQVDMSGLEDGFVAVAGSWSARKGISRDAWREFGVSPAVLKRANIT